MSGDSVVMSSIFPGQEGGCFDDIRQMKLEIRKQIGVTKKAWSAASRKVRVEENYDERDQIDSQVMEILVRMQILQKAAVDASVGERTIYKSAIIQINKMRVTVYATLLAMPPLHEEMDEEGAPKEDTIAAWKESVELLGPTVEWAASYDEKGLMLGSEATNTKAVDPLAGPSSGIGESLEQDRLLAQRQRQVEEPEKEQEVEEEEEASLTARRKGINKLEEELKAKKEKTAAAKEGKVRVDLRKKEEEAVKKIKAAEKEREEAREEAKKKLSAIRKVTAEVKSREATGAPTSSGEGEEEEPSLEEYVRKMVQRKKWDAQSAVSLMAAAQKGWGLLCQFEGGFSRKDAVEIAANEVEREREGGWSLVDRSNNKTHRPSSPKKPQSLVEANSTRLFDTPIITHSKTVEDVHRETLARSRIAGYRPSEKFDEGSHLCYQACKRKFLRATNMEGFTAEDRLAEFTHWFSGMALRMVPEQKSGKTAEEAIAQAWLRMDDYFGAQQLTPKESLRKILDSGPINRNNARAHTELALALEEEIDEAEATNCHAAYDEPHVINEVLNKKVQYYAEEFWKKVLEETGTATFRRLIRGIELRGAILRKKGEFMKNGNAGSSGSGNGDRGGDEGGEAGGSGRGGSGCGQGREGQKGGSGGNGSSGDFGSSPINGNGIKGNDDHEHAKGCYNSFQQSVQPSMANVRRTQVEEEAPRMGSQQKGPCSFCGGPHNFKACDTMYMVYLFPDGNARREIFFKNRLCFNCGGHDHITAKCWHERAVCEHCSGDHLSCLHVDRPIKKGGGHEAANDIDTEQACHVCGGNTRDRHSSAPAQLDKSSTTSPLTRRSHAMFAQREGVSRSSPGRIGDRVGTCLAGQ